MSGTISDSSGTAISGLPVSFNTQTPIISASPVSGSTVTASDGTWNLTLQQGLSGVFFVTAPSSGIGRSVIYRFNANIPLSSTASFSSVVVDG